MLIIETKDGNQVQKWITNGLCDFYDRLDEIKMIQADGHELSSIIGQFENIPISIHSVVRWQGDMAQFIILNIKW